MKNRAIICKIKGCGCNGEHDDSDTIYSKFIKLFL